ncbi:hypothetical protein ES703_102402 [subsurface metagenome]
MKVIAIFPEPIKLITEPVIPEPVFPDDSFVLIKPIPSKEPVS